LDFLKLFQVVDMDGSFAMRRYTPRLDSWFKSYELLKISAQVGAWCQAVSQCQCSKSAQNCPKLPKSAKICPTTISLRNFEMPPKSEILVFFKIKISVCRGSTRVYVHDLDFQYNNFLYVFFIVKK
jgi:hypothetical protein